MKSFARSAIWFNGRINKNDVADPPIPIFEECGKIGYYYVNTYEGDVNKPILSERKKVEATHSWGTLEVAPNGTLFTDGTKSATEDSKLLTALDNPEAKYTSNGFVVVRKNGDVVEAKSKDCVTTAKYQLCRYCLNCGKVLKDGAILSAGPNKDRHTWGDWSKTTDPADNDYDDLGDGTHHKVYTYVHRICDKCGDRATKINGMYIEAHSLVQTEVEDGPSKEPSCGVDGFVTVQLVCKCGLKDKSSIKETKIPATDKHDFGTNPVEVLPIGSIQIAKNGFTPTSSDTLGVVLEDGVYKVVGNEDPFNVYAVVVRKCNECGKYDSNGINGVVPATGKVGVDPSLIIDTPLEGRTVEVTAEALKDPNGIPYSCSAGKASITFDWSGKVNGETVRPDSQPLTIENVPYYTSIEAYQGRTDHKPVTRTETVKEPTTTQEGSAIKITECSVCKEELSREDIPIPKLGSAPSVKATAVNYNTVTVSWDAVEDAESYKVYKKSHALGIKKWQLVANVSGTSYTDTGLVTGAKYRYTVKAVVSGVGGEYSKTGAIVSPKLTAPEIKSVISVGTNKNKITWSKVDGASGYIVQRKTAAGSWTRIATVRGGSNINCRDKKAAAGSSYRVRAFRTVEKPNFVKSNVYGPFSVEK